MEASRVNRVIVTVTQISKALLKSQAHQGTSLFMSAATNQMGAFQKGVKRSSGPISRIPRGDRVAVKVGIVQVEKVDQSRRIRRDDILILSGRPEGNG